MPGSESLEEKVERLEYYIDLLRDYIVDQEKFILWDWAIANRLNRQEVRSILDFSKSINNQIKENSPPDFVNYVEGIQAILKTRIDLNVDEKFVIQLLKRISNMGMLSSLTNHYLKSE